MDNKIKKISLLLSAAVIGMSVGMSACYKNNAPPAENVLTLKWHIPNDELEDLDMVMEEFNKKLYEKAGFKVELVPIEDEYYKEKMNMKFTTGEEFDLCFIGYLLPYAETVEKGYLYDMTEMVENSYLKDSLPQYAWESSTIHGSVYAVPNMQVLFEQRALNIRKDLAEKYNLDLSSITKTEDIEPFLKLIQEKEPDLFPFRLNFNEYSFHNIENDFFVDGINRCNIWIDEVGNLQCEPFYESERYIENIYKLWDWYQKEYIREDIATVDRASNSGVAYDIEDYKNKKYAVSSNHYKPGGIYENIRKTGVEVEEVIISKPYIFRNATSATMIGINKNSKHPEEAFKLIEIINEDKELYNMLVFGLEGVHYDKIGKDRITVKEDCKWILSAWKVGNQFNSYFVDDQSEEDWKETIRLNEETPSSPFMGFYMDNSAIRKELVQIEKISKKYNARSTGALDPKTYWDDMVREFKEAGMDRVCEEVRRQAQEFLDSKKEPET